MDAVMNVGVFDGRCHECRMKFMGVPGRMGEDGYWPRDVVWHCVLCKIALCAGCKRGWDLLSPGARRNRFG